MSLLGVLRLVCRSKINITPKCCAVPANGYAAPAAALGKAKKGKKGMVSVEKKVLPVETDVNKLVKYVCGSNIYKEGQDVEIKPDSEYPDWLWEIRTGDAVPLEQLDPNTKAYWRRVRRLTLQRKNALAATRKF